MPASPNLWHSAPELRLSLDQPLTLKAKEEPALMRIYTHADCIAHPVPEGHPERPARLSHLLGHLDAVGITQDSPLLTAPAIDDRTVDARPVEFGHHLVAGGAGRPVRFAHPRAFRGVGFVGVDLGIDDHA